MVEADKLRRHNQVDFEEDLAGIDSRIRNKELVQEFDCLYNQNCERAGRKLTPVQNTALFVSGTMTRLLLPPRTHHADCLKRVSADMYVQIKK